jgi:hypothetical protein
MSDDISQLANRVGGGGGCEGQWGSKLLLSLHYLVQEEGQGGGLRSLPLNLTHKSTFKTSVPIGGVKPFS